ncbi:alpha/beta fold hydrolase [Parapedobacter sp. GCM10030251]|uniref:alpha/beta fold hydrolase n=1 Tax=Parapedobacter sp. GCM10030251 TaxID=3273419 RepID=UPI003606253D
MSSQESKNTVYTQETAPTQYIAVDGVKYAYRSFGQKEGIPLVFFIHFVATMDDWDPALINPLAEKYPIVLVDNKGVGGSGGTTPTSVEEMGDDVVKIIRALGHEKINLLGFSIGGFIAQHVAANYPDLVDKLILAGTSPKGGKYIPDILQHVENARKEEPTNPRLSLFFPKTESGRAAGLAYTERLQRRKKDDRVPPFTQEAIANQAQAIIRFGTENDSFSVIRSIKQPTLIVNGDNDTMVATSNSLDFVQNIPNSKLVIWSDSGHGALYQYHEDFVKEINEFLK